MAWLVVVPFEEGVVVVEEEECMDCLPLVGAGVGVEVETAAGDMVRRVEGSPKGGWRSEWVEQLVGRCLRKGVCML